MEAWTPKRRPKWVQIGTHFGTSSALGNTNFSNCFLKANFWPKAKHRECQRRVQAPEKATKRKPEMATEASEGMSENRCFTIGKPRFSHSGDLPGEPRHEFIPAKAPWKRSGSFFRRYSGRSGRSKAPSDAPRSPPGSPKQSSFRHPNFMPIPAPLPRGRGPPGCGM